MLFFRDSGNNVTISKKYQNKYFYYNIEHNFNFTLSYYTMTNRKVAKKSNVSFPVGTPPVKSQHRLYRKSVAITGSESIVTRKAFLGNDKQRYCM